MRQDEEGFLILLNEREMRESKVNAGSQHKGRAVAMRVHTLQILCLLANTDPC